MKHLHLTLGYLKEQRVNLNAAITTIETLLGQTNGNGHKPTLKAAGRALDAFIAGQQAETAETAAPRVKRAYRRSKGPKSEKPLPEVTVPDDFDTSGLTGRDAVIAALRATRKPVNSRTLAAIVLRGGFVPPSNVPVARYIGIQAGMLATHKLGVKKGPKGWSLR
jgi:hypothetical protein